ncbi:MAG: class I SAM-dependent rRNA methyltransferase, partial [Saprospiraceae bacterium]
LEKQLEINTFPMDRHQSVTADVVKFLSNTDEEYDLIIVDPPAFAKTLDKRHNAINGYKRLNQLAIGRVAKGGIMMTFSCSQVIDRQLFYDTITSAAIACGRNVRVLGHLSQPGDHPVSLAHPEGAYLKGLVLAVD